MVELGLSRRYVNKQVNRIKRMFRWAVAEEMVPPSVVHGLVAVPAIRRGEPGVRETEPVRPVPDSHIEASLPHVSPQVRAMVRLQRLTGMRPGEVVILRGCDLDTTGRVWVYRPHYHKGDHRGLSREVYLGPLAQAVLKPWLRSEPTAYLFNPAEAEAERNARRSGVRRTPLWPSHVARNAVRRKRAPLRGKRDHYDPDSYRRAVEYACKKADRLARETAVSEARAESPGVNVSALEATVFVPAWSPNRLRHNAATELRRQFGIELARIVLGHTTAFTTEVYAERDRVQAMDAVLRVG
jgi:integrase